MEFSEGVNYTILVNNANKAFFENFESYKVLDTMDGFDAIKMQVEVFLSKRIVFNEIWYYLSKEEKSELLEILKRRNVSFVNITSNVEDVIYSEYVIVYDDDKKILEGNKEMVLRNEKLLKRLGYGIPFVVDLSIQLNYYDIFDTVYYDMDKLTEALWN
ncbi:cobalt transporter ATP-binding subunit [Firmicutes bacterium CAG:460]|nr:cobalt transporter ATP-binding subunit [Firmicutes bacterium CAG:460]